MTKKKTPKERLEQIGFGLYSEIRTYGKYSAEELARDESRNLQLMLEQRAISGYVAILLEDNLGYRFYIR